MRVHNNRAWPMYIFIQKLDDRLLQLGRSIIITPNHRGHVMTGTMTDHHYNVLPWKWQLPLVARKCYLNGWTATNIVVNWWEFYKDTLTGEFVYLPTQMREQLLALNPGRYEAHNLFGGAWF